MSISPSKENILKKIRQALSHPVPVPFPQSDGKNSVFQPPADDLAVQFAQEFTKLQGRFAYCANEQDLIHQLNQLIEATHWEKIVCREKKLQDIFQQNGFTKSFHSSLPDCDVSITTCELLISRTGTMVLSSANESGRTTSVYAPVHICIAYTNQLVYDLKDGLQMLREKYNGQLPSFISFATGPSRTADIEKTLVVGVHGPKEVFTFLVENNASN